MRVLRKSASQIEDDSMQSGQKVRMKIHHSRIGTLSDQSQEIGRRTESGVDFSPGRKVERERHQIDHIQVAMACDVSTKGCQNVAE